MEKQDVQNVLSLLKAAYPSSFKGKTEDDFKDQLRLWYLMFQSVPAEEVQEAVVEIIKARDKDFAPSIGEVQKRLSARRNRYEPGPEEREMVMRLARKYEALEEQERRMLLE